LIDLSELPLAISQLVGKISALSWGIMLSQKVNRLIKPGSIRTDAPPSQTTTSRHQNPQEQSGRTELNCDAKDIGIAET